MQFRSNALQSLSLLPKSEKHQFVSKEDIENWIKKEYERHVARYRVELKRTIRKENINIPSDLSTEELESIFNYIHKVLQ